MCRYVDADKIGYHPVEFCGIKKWVAYMDEIEELPTYESPVPAHAHWTTFDGERITLNERGRTPICKCAYCSNCGEWLTGSGDNEALGIYCPSCGAKMDEEESEELPYDIIEKAVNGPIYYREEKEGKFTGKILKYEAPDYEMATDFDLGLISVIHVINNIKFDVVDYLFFNDFNKTWALTEEDLKGRNNE